MDLSNKKIKLLDLVSIERAKKGKIYKAGSIIIQVSATRGQMSYLENDDCVESKNAVFIFKNNDINKKYIYYILAEQIKTFLREYQTGINIKPEIFEYMDIQIHTAAETQKQIVELIENLDLMDEQEAQMVDLLKKYKKYKLNKMFVEENRW